MKKIFALLLAAIVVFCVVFVGVSILDSVTEKTETPVATATPTTKSTTAPTPQKQDMSTVNIPRISLDEWIGWQSLLDANGGLKTTPGSINAKNGISVEYVILNDATVSSNSLISGELVAAGYTVNRYAFLQDKFNQAGVKVKMPYITNYSNGGDGIIANADIINIKDLVGKRIAVPRFSEAQTLLEWLLRNSGLTSSEQTQIRSGIVYCDTADDAAEMFFSGNVNAAATWEPYLTQASSSTDSRILFDTSMSTNLILDGLVFREDFMQQNSEFVQKLIQGALEAAPMYKKNFNAIRQMPMFELMSDEEIIDAANGAQLATWADNLELLTDIAVSIYRDMANIWKDLGETAYPENAETAFTSEAIMTLQGRFSPTETSFDGNMFNATSKQNTQNASNETALLAMTLDIKFEVDSYKISAESYDSLKAFAEVAKILNGVYIQIEGNTAPVAIDDGVEFSYKRANSVARYLQVLGVDPKRFIIVGNGDKNPIADNSTEAGKALNRRTEVFFKQVVGY